MATFEIPLTPTPQAFAITLAGVTYQMTLQWRAADGGGWALDMADDNGVPIVRGIPLVTGADLLAQYGYLALGGSMFVQTDHSPDAVPTFENLGVASHLYFETP